MPQFFIKRPVFAWVIALFIILVGLIAIPRLPVERYPNVAPPSVTIGATYPGATAATMNDAVVGLIERELASVKNMLYFESSTDSTGSAQITVTFRPGVDPELALVDVQNRLKAVEPRLPQAVRQNGLSVEAATSNFLMLVGLTAPDGAFGETDLSDYMVRNVVEELRRVPGVGKVQIFGAEKAMRIWVDPGKLVAYKLSLPEVTAAIARQNAQIAPGRIGDEPARAGQQINIPLAVRAQLSTPEEFARIVLRANRNGSSVVLGDVARVELGSQSYSFSTRENGQPSTSAGVQLAPGANAVATAAAVRARLDALGTTLPRGIVQSIQLDTAPFVKLSIEKVVHTLLEAMVLVFLVMYLFLQNVRYTLIPALVAPIALLGTFTVMLAAGFSINVLTMFGMVLAIGIIVDDAIVVVENVERLMTTEGLSPRDATSKAMKEITGAVVGITLVLTAVFIPVAFAGGSVGVIYRQFALSMSVSILLSAFLALTFTPALCATLLRPAAADHAAKGGFFGWFDRAFGRLTGRYRALTAACIGRPLRLMGAWLAIAVVLVLGFSALPSSFLPDEDQGYFMTSFQLPSDATLERTLDVVKAYERHVAARPGIESNTSLLGFGFSGSGPNTAMAYTILKDRDRSRGTATRDEMTLAQDAMSASREGTAMTLMPPAIDGFGTSSGFTLRLEDRAGHGHAALRAAEQQLVKLAALSPLLADVRADGLPSGTSIRLDIDRAKAEAMGIHFADIGDTLSTAMGSYYVNDFPNAGRMQQVIVQADAKARMKVDDVLRLTVKNAGGGMVPLSEVVRPVWTEAPLQMVRYQGYPAARISGNAASGTTSGAAMDEMERLAAQLPRGFAVEWASESREERESASQAPLLMALSVIVVFLALAALYESWSIPVSVLLVVPLGLVGAVAAVLLRGLPNDVFFKVGMITVIGLSAKNAVLIVEFAKQFHDGGMTLAASALEAARLRLRPIVMTSLAFGLGVVPLVIATGASAETQHAIGTGVLGGVITATVLAVFFVPVFFVVVMGLQERVARALGKRRRTRRAQAPIH